MGSALEKSCGHLAPEVCRRKMFCDLFSFLPGVGTSRLIASISNPLILT